MTFWFVKKFQFIEEGVGGKEILNRVTLVREDRKGEEGGSSCLNQENRSTAPFSSRNLATAD